MLHVIVNRRGGVAKNRHERCFDTTRSPLSLSSPARSGSDGLRDILKAPMSRMRAKPSVPNGGRR